MRVKREYLSLFFNIVGAAVCLVRVFGVEVFVYDVLEERLSVRNLDHPVLRALGKVKSRLGFRSVVDALTVSGLLEPCGLSEVLGELLAEVEKRRENPLGYGKPLLLGVDTNILYNRIISRYVERRVGDRLKYLPIVVSEASLGEIRKKFTEEYKGDEAERFIKYLPYYARGLADWSSVSRVFRRGKATCNAYRAFLANSEYNYLKQKYRVYDAEACGIGDEYIVVSLADFEKKHNGFVFFLTMDNHTYNYALSYGLGRAALIEVPSSVPSELKVEFSDFVELVYVLTLFAGCCSIVVDCENGREEFVLEPCKSISELEVECSENVSVKVEEKLRILEKISCRLGG